MVPTSASSETPPTDAGGAAVAAGRSIDWERIELDFRAGIKSLREIAEGSGTSHVTISKHAKKHGWVRDLKAKIQAKADELVNRAVVNAPVNKATPTSERETVEAVAGKQATIRISHQNDLQRSQNIVNALLAELELQVGPENVARLEQLDELLKNPDDKAISKLRDLQQTVLSLPERAKTAKLLTECVGKNIELGRLVWNIQNTTGAEGSDKSFLEAMLNARARAANR